MATTYARVFDLPKLSQSWSAVVPEPKGTNSVALFQSDLVSGEVLGASRFTGHDPALRTVEIGYTFLVRSRWGGALNRALKAAMLAHAFQHVDRVEFFVGGRLSRAEIDTDGDGKPDRFQDWSPGYLVSEEIDRDGDGKPDIRIVHTKSGAILRVERLAR